MLELLTDELELLTDELLELLNDELLLETELLELLAGVADELLEELNEELLLLDIELLELELPIVQSHANSHSANVRCVLLTPKSGLIGTSSAHQQVSATVKSSIQYHSGIRGSHLFSLSHW